MQSVPRQAPGIRQRTMMGQPPANGQGFDPEQLRQAQQQQAIEQMSMSMYLKVATDALADGDVVIDLDTLRGLAQECHEVAKAYFEGIGSLEQDE